MPPPYRVQFCVPPGYQYLIAEIYLHDRHVAELNTESGYLQVDIFTPPADGSARFRLDELLPALQAAECELRLRSVFFA